LRFARSCHGSAAAFGKASVYGLIAAELAGGYTVINDELAEILLSIVRSSDSP
jgi:hypothetical protein